MSDDLQDVRDPPDHASVKELFTGESDTVLSRQSNDLAAFQPVLQECLADAQMPLDPGCIGKRTSPALNGNSSRRSVESSFAFLWTD